ncbi:hypothetical protein T10_10996 [Trichinella papuae]|uniref:Uncharacterized protein n=1 Tax=Trichinella papuae TaxID=268474 RepID=A0A0V1MIM8_9BILA|nr:hypothetical protein T10_10996 [Trichinella papuae]
MANLALSRLQGCNCEMKTISHASCIDDKSCSKHSIGYINELTLINIWLEEIILSAQLLLFYYSTWLFYCFNLFSGSAFKLTNFTFQFLYDGSFIFN